MPMVSKLTTIISFTSSILPGVKNPYEIAERILNGHPFLDAIKGTFILYIMLTTGKRYGEILKDFYDLLEVLSK